MDDTRPFPIQKELSQLVDGKRESSKEKSAIPWWLAEIAYEYYREQFGGQQTLERLAERGGFGREELVHLIRRENPCRFARRSS